MNIVMCHVNSFVWKKGVPQVLQPLTIVEGTVLDYNLHFRVTFGKFAQTWEGMTNAMQTHAIDAIALGLNGDMQMGVHCFNLVLCPVFCRH